MKKINVVDPTARIERLTAALAAGERANVNYELTLIKNELQRQKRSAKYYQERYDDARANVARAELESIERNLVIVKNAEKLAREYLKNPSKIRLNSTITKLNLVDKRIHEIRNIQRETKQTIISIKYGEKVNILFTRLFINNEVYNSERVFAIGREIKKILPDFDLRSMIKRSFDVDKHFNSGDEQDAIINTAIRGERGLAGAIERNRQRLSRDEIERLQGLYNELMQEMGAY